MSKRQTFKHPEKTLTTKAEDVWFIVSLTFLAAAFGYALVTVFA